MPEAYESKFWKTIPWSLRWNTLFEIYKSEFFLNEKNEIIWFKYNNRLFWKKSEIIIELWISNQILWILKTWEKDKSNWTQYELWFYWEEAWYENINELLKELTIAYSFKIKQIIQ